MLKIFIYAQFLVGFWAAFPHEQASLPRVEEPAFRVYVFLGTDCPVSQDYVGVLNEMEAEYQPEIEFVGVIPEAVGANEVSSFRKEYQVRFDLMVDKKLALVNKYGIRITPEVVVVDDADAVRYQGAIDNWYYALGKHRQAATEHYLKDAIGVLLMNQDVKIKKTEAVGCIINVHHH